MIDVFPIGSSDVRLWSMDQQERLARAVSRAPAETLLHKGLNEACIGQSAVLVRLDWCMEERILQALFQHANTILFSTQNGQRHLVAAHVPANMLETATNFLTLNSPDKEIPDGLHLADVDELCGSFNDELRKKDPPYLMPLSSDNTRRVEWTMYRSAYKGVTDFVTKYIWPVPAFHTSRMSARLGLSPNFITSISLVMVLIAFWAFWEGQFWTGIIASYVMIFLDTVDGKLARVTLTSSKWGNAFDHGIDLVHPPFWYWAWWQGLIVTGLAASPLMQEWGLLSLGIIIAGYIAGRIIEGIFIYFFHIHIHIWKPVDSWMREITARRNPNLVIMTIGLALGRPDLGFLAVAVWTVICTGFHIVRLVQAGWVKARGNAVVSWLS